MGILNDISKKAQEYAGIAVDKAKDLAEVAALREDNYKLAQQFDNAPTSFEDALDNYEEYEAHIRDKKCPAGKCKSLFTMVIDPEKCKGCTLCARNCPVGAITGTVRNPHVIDAEKCIKCGVCLDNCRFGAISKQ